MKRVERVVKPDAKIYTVIEDNEVKQRIIICKAKDLKKYI